MERFREEGKALGKLNPPRNRKTHFPKDKKPARFRAFSCLHWFRKVLQKVLTQVRSYDCLSFNREDLRCANSDVLLSFRFFSIQISQSKKFELKIYVCAVNFPFKALFCPRQFLFINNFERKFRKQREFELKKRTSWDLRNEKGKQGNCEIKLTKDEEKGEAESENKRKAVNRAEMKPSKMQTETVSK